ncbi:shikimate kinase [Candidatus Uabimicrobium sp. HlEnr_7]|uniref:shikimate kinase n=1 Tax=Candidatus Uabimicrobium helgolandensis TaxID=3095367 RepID=UPI0035579268
MSFDKNIYLIGMMGAGKSTVGKYLARLLKLRFIDLDVEIEKDANMQITKIFQIHGENYFRLLEESILAKMSSNNSSVIATGGGCILSSKNRKIMSRNGYRVFLKVDIDTLYDRLTKSYTRPLAKSKKQLQSIYNERYSLYCDCDQNVNAVSHPQIVAKKIYDYLK